MHAFAKLDLMRSHLKWAYQRPLANSVGRQPYVHSPIAAWYVRRGKLTLFYDDDTREECLPGEWVFPREARGLQQYSGDLEIISIRFEVAWPHGEPLFSRSRTVRIPGAKAPELLAAAEGLVEVVRSDVNMEASWVMQGSLEAYWRMQEQFQRWLIAWYRAFLDHGVALNRPDAIDPKVREALEWLAGQPPDAEIREAALAARIGLSVSQLNKLFTFHTGATPIAHWQRRRLEIARNLLLGSSESIKAIAFQLGFSTPEYFATWFRKQQGASPSSYRLKYGGRGGAQHWV